MCNKQKIILHTVSLPIPRGSAIMLLFNNEFLQGKASFLKNLHHIEGHRHHAAFLSGIAHQHRTELILFQHTIAFLRHLFYFLKEICNLQAGKIFLNILTVLDNVRIRRVGADKIHMLVLDEGKVSGVTFL